MARVACHDSQEAFMATIRPARLFAFSTRGTRRYMAVRYQLGDALLFGPETRGLPEDLLAGLRPEHVFRIPMTAKSRSLNLSNAVAVVIYEAWRQLGFPGAGRDD
jgi:tRNA (cytidine/uridine-2'-O-)-methyltransferase